MWSLSKVAPNPNVVLVVAAISVEKKSNDLPIAVPHFLWIYGRNEKLQELQTNAGRNEPVFFKLLYQDFTC